MYKKITHWLQEVPGLVVIPFPKARIPRNAPAFCCVGNENPFYACFLPGCLEYAITNLNDILYIMFILYLQSSITLYCMYCTLPPPHEICGGQRYQLWMGGLEFEVFSPGDFFSKFSQNQKQQKKEDQK